MEVLSRVKFSGHVSLHIPSILNEYTANTELNSSF